MDARIVVTDTIAGAEREIRRTGADEYAVPLMAPKAVFRAVAVRGVDNRAANLLKQEMLALGGEAAIDRAVGGFSRGISRVLLMGTLRQYRVLLSKLAQQPFGLKRLGNDIADALAHYDQRRYRVAAGKHTLRLEGPAAVMGILNVTPDSFSDGGAFLDPGRAVEHACRMEQEGAAIIDIGGESTRPGARAVSAKEEAARVVPVIRLLARRTKLPISVDTYKPEVARAALDAGAGIVNDITGLRYKKGALARIVAHYRAAVVIMHMQGTPRTMQQDPRYGDVVEDIGDFLRERAAFAQEQGIDRRRIILDPGIGFGKTQEHNLALLRRLAEFRALGYPLLIGASRKRFIGCILDGRPPDERQYGSIGAAVAAAQAGAHMVRVHDVRETVDALRVVTAISTAAQA